MAKGVNGLLSLASLMARWLPDSWKRGLYRVKPLSRIIRASLNRSAPLGLVEVPVAAGALAGLKLLLDLQTEKDYWLGTYEMDLQEAVASRIQPGWIVYDVGANIGYVSLVFAQAVGATGKVFAFEAFPENVRRLQRNLELNPAQAHVEVVAAAVVDAARPVTFLVGPSNGMGKVEGSAGRQDVTYTQQLAVPGISLDEFAFAQGHPLPQAVKIDIEGGEVLALPGMSRLLKDARPLLFLELHGEAAARAAWQALNPLGYRISPMAHPDQEVRAVEELDWKAYLVAIP
jgi:FkbM family methyltransferase